MSDCTHPITFDEQGSSSDAVDGPYSEPDWFRGCALCDVRYNRTRTVMAGLRRLCEISWSIDFRRFPLDHEDALEIAG